MNSNRARGLTCPGCGAAVSGRFCSHCGRALHGDSPLEREIFALFDRRKWSRLLRDLFYSVVRPTYLSRAWIADGDATSPFWLLVCAISISFALSAGLLDEMIRLFGHSVLEGTFAFAFRPFLEERFADAFRASESDPVHYMLRHRILFQAVGLPISVLVGTFPVFWVFRRSTGMRFQEAYAINLYTRAGMELMSGVLVFTAMMAKLYGLILLAVLWMFLWPVIMSVVVSRIYDIPKRRSIPRGVLAYLLIQVGLMPVMLGISVIALHDSRVYDWFY
ncbi:MAG TPA: zinc ribbon domain-containing protein [Allosphingosinicella sp.]